MKLNDKLHAYWSKRENDLMVWHPEGTGTRCDGHWLVGSVFVKAFTDELKTRGYDVTTMRFSIEPQKGNTRFASQRETPSVVTRAPEPDKQTAGWTLEQVKAEAEKLFAEAELAHVACKLPSGVDDSRVNQLCHEIVTGFWNQKPTPACVT